MMEKYFSLLYDAAGRHKRLIAAVWVSALTTIVGAFSLLFARHPALFSIGLTLTMGLMAGYLAAQFAVPALYRMWMGKKEK